MLDYVATLQLSGFDPRRPTTEPFEHGWEDRERDACLAPRS
jgi:hypothetical protein